jgi:hypothetical protein
MSVHTDLHELSLHGETWAEWAAREFEFELCHECGGDADNHEPWVILGNWFAHCLTTPED